MRTYFGIIAATLLLCGCATQTAYQPAERRGAEGYTETKLTENRYRITFIGNSVTPQDTVKDYALLRAAELTLQNGYDWFQISSKDDSQKVKQNATVGIGAGIGSETSVYQQCGLVRCSTAVVTSPGFDSGLVSESPTTNYSSSIEIVSGKYPMPNNFGAYDAKQLAQALRGQMQHK